MRVVSTQGWRDVRRASRALRRCRGVMCGFRSRRGCQLVCTCDTSATDARRPRPSTNSGFSTWNTILSLVHFHANDLSVRYTSDAECGSFGMCLSMTASATGGRIRTATMRFVSTAFASDDSDRKRGGGLVAPLDRRRLGEACGGIGGGGLLLILARWCGTTGPGPASPLLVRRCCGRFVGRVAIRQPATKPDNGPPPPSTVGQPIPCPSHPSSNPYALILTPTTLCALSCVSWVTILPQWYKGHLVVAASLTNVQHLHSALPR